MDELLMLYNLHVVKLPHMPSRQILGQNHKTMCVRKWIGWRGGGFVYVCKETKVHVNQNVYFYIHPTQIADSSTTLNGAVLHGLLAHHTWKTALL